MIQFLIGGKITANHSDGTSREYDITPSMVSGYNKNTIGTQTLTVTYEGKETTFDVTVRAPVLKAPLSITCTLYGYDDIQASWSKVSEASGYYVYIKKSTAKSYTYVGSTTSLSKKIANLADGAKYDVRVIPYKIDGLPVRQ